MGTGKQIVHSKHALNTHSIWTVNKSLQSVEYASNADNAHILERTSQNASDYDYDDDVSNGSGGDNIDDGT